MPCWPSFLTQADRWKDAAEQNNIFTASVRRLHLLFQAECQLLRSCPQPVHLMWGEEDCNYLEPLRRSTSKIEIFMRYNLVYVLFGTSKDVAINVDYVNSIGECKNNRNRPKQKRENFCFYVRTHVFCVKRLGAHKTCWIQAWRCFANTTRPLAAHLPRGQNHRFELIEMRVCTSTTDLAVLRLRSVLFAKIHSSPTAMPSSGQIHCTCTWKRNLI